ncbi:MAG: hypothetical protein LBC64_01780 [Fibromonadaceae bacterium]|jgi:hypothetical protein|nr:hypothetical protein [Fibromonadaceae bacterium]
MNKNIPHETVSRKGLTVTSKAFNLVESERLRLLRRTGKLKPRYEIVSDIICAALGERGKVGNA